MTFPKHPDCQPLIVDDDRDFRLLLKRGLEKTGIPRWQIRTCGDGGEAISLLSIDSWVPSFVLLDLNMPGRTGLEVLQWIRSAAQPLGGVPVFMMTSDANPDHVSQAFRAGIGSYFIKPLDLQTLDLMLEGIVAHWRRHCPGLIRGGFRPESGGLTPVAGQE